MQAAFYKLYEDYSTTELLKIIRQSAHYQPEAVKAAQQVLSTRIISENEIAEVEQHFSAIEQAEKARLQKNERYKNAVADFFEPVLQPTAPMHPGKWLKFVLLLIILQYLWSVYTTIRYFIHVSQFSHNHHFDITDGTKLFSIVYLPVIFALLYKKSRWGWILLFVDNVLSITSVVLLGLGFMLYNLCKNHYYHYTIASPQTFLQLVVNGTILWFLCTDNISAYFNVSPIIKKRTVIVSVAFALTALVSALITIW